MSQVTAEKMAQRVFDLGLIDDRRLRQIWGELGSRDVDVDTFLQRLVRREILTNYQVGQLLSERKHGFWYGDFKVLYLVGAGTFARVFRAAHKDTGRVVAVKVLRARYSKEPKNYGPFMREGEIGKTLRHPNIVPIYEVQSHRGTHYLVMEFVEGRSLKEFIKVRGRLAMLEAIRLTADIASGLQHAFEKGVTHRDLKISNVLISSRGRAKIVDFGLAGIDETFEDTATDFNHARTIDYAALERATGVRANDSRSDIYFLGCIFYHMLCGEPALAETRDRIARMSKQRLLDVKPLHHHGLEIPPAVGKIVHKAMQLDPRKRYQAPGEMLADLRMVAKRLREKGETHSGESGLGSGLLAPGERRSVMVVESNQVMQGVFRDGFKKAGYRVLISSDPDRALLRLRENPEAAELVIFNAQEFGKSALSVFNRFGEDNRTATIPVILLLDAGQEEWKHNAHLAKHRVAVTMPITMKQLRGVVNQMLTSEPTPSR